MYYAAVENITDIEDEIFARTGRNLDLKELFWPDSYDIDCFRPIEIPNRSDYDEYSDDEVAVFKYLRTIYPRDTFILIDMTRRWKT